MNRYPVADARLLVVLSVCPLNAVAQQDRPNIVVMLMDNLGYGELGVYGGGILRGAPTPRIDTLRQRRHAAAQLQR